MNLDVQIIRKNRSSSKLFQPHFWIRHTHPDPVPTKMCGSGSSTLPESNTMRVKNVFKFIPGPKTLDKYFLFSITLSTFTLYKNCWKQINIHKTGSKSVIWHNYNFLMSEDDITPKNCKKTCQKLI